MNDQYKIDWEARILGFNQEFDNNSYSQPNPENMEIWVQQQQQQQQDIGHHHHHHHDQESTFVRNKPSSTTTTIMSRFETPTSAFYATERCMGFSHYDSQNRNFCTTNNNHNNNTNNNNNNLCLSSQFYNSSSFSDSSFDHQTEPNFEIRVRPNNIDPFISHVNAIPCLTSHFSLNPKEDHSIGMSFDSSHHNHHQNKQSLKLASGNGSVTKTRIRWTQELHEKFVECLNRLGGAEKATPKGILRLMESEGLTIFHVKSHLQKYRIAKYLPDTAEGKYEKRASVDVNPQLEATTTGQQIKEALHLQLDVQRRLHEQLEIQRKLQLQIEEQGKQLKMMFDMQQRRSSTGQSSDISTLDEEAPSSDTNDDLEVSIHVPSKIS